MTLHDTLVAQGLTPPQKLIAGRWLRFPGFGKGRSNRAGWCRLITPTLAIYGDWSTGLREIWRDTSHRDDEESRRLLEDARRREREFAKAQAERARAVECEALALLSAAICEPHPYLAAKGFPSTRGFVHAGELLVPVRAVEDYRRLITLQRIAPDGTKRFLTGGRAQGGIHRLGDGRGETFLCEGYATGLSLYEAARRLHRNPSVVVAFSAGNLEAVAGSFPHATVCADHDASGTGERIARKTGLPWVMPDGLGDFNDLHRSDGLHAVVAKLRGR